MQSVNIDAMTVIIEANMVPIDAITVLYIHIYILYIHVYASMVIIGSLGRRKGSVIRICLIICFLYTIKQEKFESKKRLR